MVLKISFSRGGSNMMVSITDFFRLFLKVDSQAVLLQAFGAIVSPVSEKKLLKC